MAKYHLSKKGEPAPCSARKRECPLGADTPHFNSREEAQAAAEARFQEAHGALATKRRAGRSDELASKPLTGGGLNGRTLSQYVEDLKAVEAYVEATPFPQEAIDRQLGAQVQRLIVEDEDAYGYITTSFEDGKLHVTVDTGSLKGYDYNDEFMNWRGTGEENAVAELEDYPQVLALREAPGFEELTHEEGGYYGEGNSATFTFTPQGELKEYAEKTDSYRKSYAARKRLSNSALPQWAALPAEASYDGEKNYTEEEQAEQHALSGLYKYEKTAPRLKKTDVDHLRAVAEGKPDPKGGEKVAALLKKDSEELATLRAKRLFLREGERSASVDYSELEGLRPPVKGRDKNVHERIETLYAIEKEIATTKRRLGARKRRLTVMTASPQERKAASESVLRKEEQYKKDLEAYEKEKKDFYAKRLSYNYPSSDRKVAYREASKWVEAHPELLEKSDLWYMDR